MLLNYIVGFLQLVFIQGVRENHFLNLAKIHIWNLTFILKDFCQMEDLMIKNCSILSGTHCGGS